MSEIGRIGLDTSKTVLTRTGLTRLGNRCFG